MSIFYKSSIVIITLCFTLLQAAIQYEIEYKNNNSQRYGDATIRTLVSKALDPEHASIPIGSVRVHVYSKNNGKENYFHVTLFYSSAYGSKSYRLDIAHGKVVNIVEKYSEESDYDDGYCGECPDEKVQVLLSNIYAPAFPLAESKTTEVADACQKANIKVVRLRNKDESLKNVLDYLACPKLRIWGRIGHGSETGEANLLSGEDFTVNTIQSNKALIKGKIFPFNSCYIGGNSFAQAMVDAEAMFICAGDNVEIWTGSSEPVWAAFSIDIITNKKELVEAFNLHMKNAKDKWGYKTSGTGPFYVTWDNTGISAPGASTPSDIFSIMVNPNNIVLNLSSMKGASKLFIYTLTGELLYSQTSVTPQIVWDMKNQQGGKIKNGMYIAIVNNSTQKAAKKKFSIIK